MFLELFSPLTTALKIIGILWWIYTPVLLFAGTMWARQTYINEKYRRSLKWVLLEIKPPPQVLKSPKVAEYIFSNLHATQPTSSTLSWKKRFFTGVLPDWFSLEIVSTSGESHIYIRTLEKHRNFVETQIFAQYPSAEVRLVDVDYVQNLSPSIPNEEYNLFGSELILANPDVYPIRTHLFFEEPKSSKEDPDSSRTDPLSALFESLSLLGPGEHLWIQFIVSATGNDWAKATKEEIDKIMGKVEGKDVSPVDMTPGKREAILAIEHKASQLGFKGGVRFIFIGPNNNFNRGHISGVFGFFKQFNTINLNSFRPNGDTMPVHDGFLHQIFPSNKGFLADVINYKRKKELYKAYRDRKLLKKSSVFNVEELATLFHLPGTSIKAPLFPRVESKKSQPPTGLPIG